MRGTKRWESMGLVWGHQEVPVPEGKACKQLSGPRSLDLLSTDDGGSQPFLLGPLDIELWPNC